jgi:hypothetical protein
MNSVTSQLKINKAEQFKKPQELGYFIMDTLYQQYPNIVLPSLQLPMQAVQNQRFSEKLDKSVFTDKLIPLNP